MYVLCMSLGPTVFWWLAPTGCRLRRPRVGTHPVRPSPFGLRAHRRAPLSEACGAAYSSTPKRKAENKGRAAKPGANKSFIRLQDLDMTITTLYKQKHNKSNKSRKQ